MMVPSPGGEGRGEGGILFPNAYFRLTTRYQILSASFFHGTARPRAGACSSGAFEKDSRQSLRQSSIPETASIYLVPLLFFGVFSVFSGQSSGLSRYRPR